MLAGPLAEALHRVYPLFVASGVVLGLIPLGVVQSMPERIPPIFGRLNKWFIEVAAFLAIVTVLLAFIYIAQPDSILFSCVISIEFVALCFLVTAYLSPILITLFPPLWPLWKKLQYDQFVRQQVEDQERLKSMRDSNRPMSRNSSVYQEKPEP